MTTPPIKTVTRKTLSHVGIHTTVQAAQVARAAAKLRRQGKRVKAIVKRLDGDDFDDFLASIPLATVDDFVEVERKGLPVKLVKNMAGAMEITSTRMYNILGLAKATVEKKAAGNERIAGAGGQAAINMAKLLALAESIVANSTAKEAKDFDTAKWFGQWIERPQPALGGRKPSEYLDTPTGAAAVTRVLGAIESGAYQ